MAMRFLIGLALAAALAIPLGASAEDVVGHVERVLKQAAQESRHWHSRQDSIQRDLHDIVFFLDQSLTAGEKSDVTGRKQYAEQAHALLKRGMALGYFDGSKTEPVLSLIRQLLAG